ncbi:MAG: valine--tRNA ligase [Planctomycetota bacterium]|nr:valine--tRNA ligase [Planctomycetota bacterium]
MSTDAPSARADLPKQYRPAEHEGRAWRRWIDARAFHADPHRVLRGEARPYCVLIPPPNVTAALHLGHALNNTLQDILVRAHRMRGFETLWMPGTDHAGIATQAVVEKRVWQDEKKRRTDFSRDEFVAKIQAFKDEYEATITGQLQAMGCSCDWDRQRFTMDSVCARAVREAFFRLFRDGLIYRGKRLVNWDPVLQTAVADDECYDEEIDGAFYYLRYPLVRGTPTLRVGDAAPDAAHPTPVTWGELASRGYPDADTQPPDAEAWITVATTRPETYLGDTGVAINPHDPRAKALKGLCCELPLLGRVIPIVEDSYVVLPERYARTDEEKADPKAAMATGFLKVTPAHDPNDAEIGQRHALGAVNMMSPDGKVSASHGWTDIGDAHLFVGKSMRDARKLVVREFEARGLLEGQKPHRHSVKHSDRSKAIIEPYLSDQWYVKVTDPRLAARANAALASQQRSAASSAPAGASASDSSLDAGDGTMRFFPARYAKTFEHWHDNIRDWCISRQLWWGHRIPVWSKEHVSESEQNLLATMLDDGVLAADIEWRRSERGDGSADVFICFLDPNDPHIAHVERHGFVQDPDVLDTWFSSALWPLSTLGWPDGPQAARDTGLADFPALLDAFNPTSALCTAREIITLWVSRMTMFNRYLRSGEVAKWQSGKVTDAPHSATSSPGHSATSSGPPPFRDVFIHAVIQDGEGRKMSKSLGNGVDPLDIIATHGADAMRFTLCHMATNTQDVRLPVTKGQDGRNTSPKFDLGRNFATKLWNATRFAMEKLGGSEHAAPRDSETGAHAGGSLPLPDRWMLSRLARAIADCDRALANYEFADYAQTCYTLLWNDFCDWYLEAVKPTVAENPAQQGVLRATLDAILRLLHPVMPFVTETIFEALAGVPASPVRGLTLEAPRTAGLLATAGWPQADPSLVDADAESRFARVQQLVTAIREVRAQHNVVFKRAITLHIPDDLRATLGEGERLVATLCNLGTITGAPPAGPGVPITLDTRELRLSDLADEVDTDAERTRLSRAVADLTKSKATLEGRLSNPGYTDKAPPAMVQQTRDQLTKISKELDAARAALEAL